MLIDEAIATNEQGLLAAEKARSNALREVGNHLHSSVPVDDDEDHNLVERTHGDCTSRSKYSHVDLICMIDGKSLEMLNLFLHTKHRHYDIKVDRWRICFVLTWLRTPYSRG